jgi:hypothetical protein
VFHFALPRIGGQVLAKFDVEPKLWAVSAVPTGTLCHEVFNPALNCRAIFKGSGGTGFRELAIGGSLIIFQKEKTPREIHGAFCFFDSARIYFIR